MLLLFIFILLVTEKKKEKQFRIFVINGMYSKCIQKIFMNTGLLKKYLNTIRIGLLVFIIFL